MSVEDLENSRKNMILLKSFAEKNILDPVSIGNVSFLDSDEKIEWSINEEELTVTSPSKSIDEMATVIKVVISQ